MDLLHAGKTRTLTLGSTPTGNAGLVPKPQWTVSPVGGVSLFPSSDGTSCDVQYVAPLASQTITVTATPGPVETPPLAALTQTEVIQTVAPPSFSTTALPAATQTVPYTAPLVVIAGLPPYTFAITAGALPAGLSLSTAGVISGTPTAGGITTFTAQVTDANGSVATQPLGITVTPIATGLTITVGPEH